jgi:two-component system chemotaxis response regulator CheB
MARLRVLVAEDSLTVRRHLCDILAADPSIEVVGEAEDGKRAIELCLALRPDVMTLDMVMPVMSGLAATEYIMAHCPTPILIVSSSTNRGELFKTYDALAAGAVEVLEKPGAGDDGPWGERLRATLRLVARVKVITHLRARLAPPRVEHFETALAPPAGVARRYEVLALGASTGGPGAILRVLRDLPQNLPWPVLVVLHIGEPFGAALAEWLDGQTVHSVDFARHGQALGTRGVWLATPGRHLLVRDGRLWLSDAPERHSCRPAVDVLFESLARECGGATIACLLTGMGRDGALGLRAIRAAGGLTIAEDESSCVVYGMPREAVLLDAAVHILPLEEVGSALRGLATSAGCRESK